LSSQNENPDEYNNNNPSNEAKERSKITHVNPDQVLEEKEKSSHNQ
jgi:hypothetical protein